MKLDAQTCYQAILTHDARFDGRFFVGISTTGVYCRPVCPARTPKPENCTFFSTAAAAELAGFRPCLRCRPELAPGNSSIDAAPHLAERAAELMEETVINGSPVRNTALRLGVSDRHLRRVFQSEYGLTPVQYVQTQRLLTAKRLLTDTRLPITEIAMASGFSSLRRFNGLFRSRYRLSPSELRKKAGAVEDDGVLTFRLSYRPPFEWDGLIGFLGKRAVEGVESVDGRLYRRSIAIGIDNRKDQGWIEVFPSDREHALEVRVSPSLIKNIRTVLARIKRLFDLSCHPEIIDTALGDIAARRPGLRVPGAFDGFEVAVRAIIGQQVTVKSARTLAGRFAEAFGDSVSTPFPEIRRTFPGPGRIAGLTESDISLLGVLPQRSRTIIALAKMLEAGELELDPGAAIEAAVGKLMTIPGIGDWTAQYIAMRALSWPDAFPATDYGVKKAMNERKLAKTLEHAEKWRPWRAYAVMHLWASLEEQQP